MSTLMSATLLTASQIGYVYLSANLDGELLYVGSTNDMRRRILEHRRLSDWWSRASWVKFATVSSLSLAREFERDLISTLAPLHNVRLRNAPPSGSSIFPRLPYAATAVDLKAVLGVQRAYVSYMQSRLDAYRDSMAIFDGLRTSDAETLGECTERLRKQGPIST